MNCYVKLNHVCYAYGTGSNWVWLCVANFCILVEGIKPIPYANSDSQVVMYNPHVRKLQSMNSLLSDNWNNHPPKKYEDLMQP